MYNIIFIFYRYGQDPRVTVKVPAPLSARRMTTNSLKDFNTCNVLFFLKNIEKFPKSRVRRRHISLKPTMPSFGKQGVRRNAQRAEDNYIGRFKVVE